MSRTKLSKDYSQSKTILFAASPCIGDNSRLLNSANRTMERIFVNEGKSAEVVPDAKGNLSEVGKDNLLVYLYYHYKTTIGIC